MMTKAQIKKAYIDGWLDEIAKELTRYGTIIKDYSFEIESGYHAGSHRVLEIEHYGIAWIIEKHNGEVKTLGRTTDK